MKMKNPKLQILKKINAIYLIALAIFTVYFVTSEFTYDKFFALAIGISQGFLLLTYEQILINK